MGGRKLVSRIRSREASGVYKLDLAHDGSFSILLDIGHRNHLAQQLNSTTNTICTNTFLPFLAIHILTPPWRSLGTLHPRSFSTWTHLLMMTMRPVSDPGPKISLGCEEIYTYVLRTNTRLLGVHRSICRFAPARA